MRHEKSVSDGLSHLLDLRQTRIGSLGAVRETSVRRIASDPRYKSSENPFESSE